MLESTFKNPWILTKKNTHKSSGKIHATSSKLLRRDTYQLLLGRKKNPAPRRVHWVGRGIPTCEHPKPENPSSESPNFPDVYFQARAMLVSGGGNSRIRFFTASERRDFFFGKAIFHPWKSNGVSPCFHTLGGSW